MLTERPPDNQEVEEVAVESVLFVVLKKTKDEPARPDKASLAPEIEAVREVGEVALMDSVPAVGATVSILKAKLPPFAVANVEVAPLLSIAWTRQ